MQNPGNILYTCRSVSFDFKLFEEEGRSYSDTQKDIEKLSATKREYTRVCIRVYVWLSFSRSARYIKGALFILFHLDTIEDRSSICSAQHEKHRYFVRKRREIQQLAQLGPRFAVLPSFLSSTENLTAFNRGNIDA